MENGVFEKETFKRAITAVRRAIIPLQSDRIFDIDEIGAFEIPATPSIVSRPRAPVERRARLRLSIPRFAPPAWRLHRRRFAHVLADGFPFALLEPELREELASLATWVAVPAGGSLFAEGTPLDALYVVAQGTFSLSRMVDGFAHSLGTARPGDALGVASALGHYGALATAQSRTGASVLRLPTACVVDAACSSPAFYAALSRMGQIRSHCHTLAGSAFSELMGPEGRAGVASLFKRVALAPRQPLVLPGQLDSFVAIVEQGQLAHSAFAQGQLGPERVVRTVARGQALGCVAGLQGRAAVGAVRATEPTVLSVLDADDFGRLSMLHRSLPGLPALLADRGELGSGGFFVWEGVRTAAQVRWRERADQIRAVA